MSVTALRRPASRPRTTRTRPRIPAPRAATIHHSASTGGWTVTVSVDAGAPIDPRVEDLLRDLRRLAAPPIRPVRAVVPDPVDDDLVRIDARARTVRRGGTEISLTRLEFDLLLFLATHPGEAFSRGELLARVWGGTPSGPRTVDIHVRRLRGKTGGAPLIATVRTIGYRLADGAPIVPLRA